MRISSATIVLIALWVLSVGIFGVLLLQQNKALKRLENSSNELRETRYNELDSIYKVGFTSLQDRITAINDTLELARLRQLTQINTLNYRLTQSTRKYESLNSKLSTANNDSLLLLLAEYLSEADTVQSR